MDKKFLVKKEDELQSDDDFVADEKRPLIPEGMYQVCCIGAEESMYMGTPKMYVHFLIINSEEYNGTKLLMAMNLSDSKTKKRFKKVPIASKYYEQWVIANQDNMPARDDRMSPAIFKDGYFEAVVETVKPKFDGKTEKPDSFHYSIIRYLKRRLE